MRPSPDDAPAVLELVHHPVHGPGVPVVPPSDGQDGNLNPSPILAHRALLPEGIVTLERGRGERNVNNTIVTLNLGLLYLVLEPVFDPGIRSVFQSPLPLFPSRLSPKELWVGRPRVPGEHDTSPAQHSVPENAAAFVVDVVREAVVCNQFIDVGNIKS